MEDLTINHPVHRVPGRRCNKLTYAIANEIQNDRRLRTDTVEGNRPTNRRHIGELVGKRLDLRSKKASKNC